MRWNQLRRLKLAHALLGLLLPALLLVSLADLRVRAADVHRAADTAYDRSLLGALKSVDAGVSTESGGLSVELPYRVFEFFELTASGPVHYRVATADGLVELGSGDLPAPPAPLREGVAQFYDGEYFGTPVRLVAFARALDRPTEGSPSRQLIVQVAESTRSRDEFRHVFLRRAIAWNAVLLAVASLLAVVTVMFVLRPLARASRELALRPAGDTSPLPLDGLPADVRPFADAINRHMRHVDALATRQRTFLDDASHQLRTHLTTLRMQVDFALRERDGAEVRAALVALADELQRAARSTNQLLALARSESSELGREPFDLREAAAEVARQFLPAAREKGLDVGIESDPATAVGDAGMLKEAVANLVANAIAYTPRGSVTIRTAADDRGFSFIVEDAGPGLPADLSTTAGTRFARSRTSASSGSGLGLAIARSVAERHGGTLELCSRPEGGLRATIRWPR
jgi:two-component system, OmpR family, sensor histidine kinase TctE